jgi:hypothetical protein
MERESGGSSRVTGAILLPLVSSTLVMTFASLLVAIGSAIVAMWLLGLAMSLNEDSGLLPWTAAGILVLGPVFVGFAAMFSVPGILWSRSLAASNSPVGRRWAKAVFYLGTTVLLMGAGAAVAVLFWVKVHGRGEAQPESARTVAAFEVPLPSEADRSQFLSVLRAAAEPEGMHVDATSSQELERESKVSPEFQMTLNAAVWRGSKDDEPVASAMDRHDHLGQVWITFLRGKDPTLTRKFQESAMREIMLRWPGTLSLPIMPTGAIPLHGDLVRTPNGYIVNPSEAHKYGLDDAQERPH